MLLRVILRRRQRLALVQVGQRRIQLLLLVVAALLIDGREAGKAHTLMARTEQVLSAAGLDGRHVIDGARHLRRQKAAPDQLIEPELVLRQVVLHHLRRQLHMTRPDGLVRILRAGFRLIAPRAARIIGRAIAAADHVRRRGQRLLRDAQRVGSHICDQTNRAFARDLHTFIELLRDHHRAPRRHVELAGRLLLERRRDERRRGILLLLGVLDALHAEFAGLQLLQNGVDRLAVRQLALLRVSIIVRHKAAGLAHAGQVHIQ